MRSSGVHGRTCVVGFDHALPWYLGPIITQEVETCLW